MKILVATEKPFAPVAIEGIRKEVEAAGHQLVLLEKYNDIAFLADLMGHESIETTRIYLRRTATEQQQIVDKIVTW